MEINLLSQLDTKQINIAKYGKYTPGGENLNNCGKGIIPSFNWGATIYMGTVEEFSSSH